MLEQAIADAAEHAERMLKTFKSGCAVAEDLLQLMIDKLDAVRQSAQGASGAANVLGTVEQDLRHAESAIAGAAAADGSMVLPGAAAGGENPST